MDVVYTVGHSSRSFEEFLGALTPLHVELVVDVRRWPSSRRYPHFNRDNLEHSLPRHGVKYLWIPELGGYRRFGVDVEDRGVATCFESEGFRAYATYILVSPAARRALWRLEGLARSFKTAIMCSERVPWRCHRKILADWLLSRGFRVVHIIDPGRLVGHRFTRCAAVEEGRLTYI